MRRWWAISLVIGLAASLPTGVRAAPAGCGDQPDFNGDGRADLAVGVPQDDTNDVFRSGSVHVFYGTAGGLGTADDEIISQATSGVADQPDSDDELGSTLATGDFDGDGFTDLAIGVDNEDLEDGVTENEGAVHVLYGSAQGITTDDALFLHQDISGAADDAEEFDQFGHSLASGDFDNDGRCDLAVGIRGENFDSGAVHAFYGSSTGITTSGDQVLTQDTTGMADQSEEGDQFGRRLASGDFDNDGRDDLVVGIPNESLNLAFDREGAIHVVYGSSTGLTTSGDQFLHQDVSGFADVAGPQEGFGRSLATGDFDNDGRDDLAVGIPFQGLDDGSEGAIHVIYGSSTGLSASGDQFIHQNVSGMADEIASVDLFGWALASGDFDNDGRDDVAVGVPGEDFDGVSEGGAIHVIYGSSTGLSASGDQFIHQDTTGIANQINSFDAFGYALGSGDFGGDGRDDVAVGVQEDLDPVFDDEGAIAVIDGSSTGLTASGDQFLHRGVLGVEGDPREDAYFGGSFPGGVFSDPLD